MSEGRFAQSRHLQIVVYGFFLGTEEMTKSTNVGESIKALWAMGVDAEEALACLVEAGKITLDDIEQAALASADLSGKEWEEFRRKHGLRN